VSDAWLRPSGLFTDLYELTMMQAYQRHGPHGEATFDLFVRDLPGGRNVLLAAGLATVLEQIDTLAFSDEDVDFLEDLGMFRPEFLDRLRRYRFSGDVWAVPEGTPVFAGEPILRVTGPIFEAQLLETLVMNQVHLQTLIASKAARIVLAADGRAGLVDFGLRRMHGLDAGVMGARALWIAGFDGTSNVLAGKLLGIPVSGTMAHSFVQCHPSEEQAFRDFLDSYPETVLLVDTYDTERGVERVVEIARELGDGFRARGIRLDSGDLVELARSSRRKLDDAGLDGVRIFASGNLDEHRIADLLGRGAPIDAFGVGTRLGTSQDEPNLDIVYKLAQLDDRPLLKLSTDKATLPGVKQVWRRYGDDGRLAGDVIGLADEGLEGEPLLVPAMRDGHRVDDSRETLDEIRARAADRLGRLPETTRSLDPADPPYPIVVSDRLRELRDGIAERIASER
jgi:nicotinate phosphoribosyltransferase